MTAANTLANLIDHCEADLSDSGNATWTAADVEQWCRDAILDYSLHFPRIKMKDITTSANDRDYDLEADFLSVVSVEYPQGQTPPEYLEPREYQHPDFWLEDGYYDVVLNEDKENAAELWISEKPSASQTIRVHYQALHDYTIATNENLTVPYKHHHILRAYVVWKALVQLKHAEEASPTSNSSLLMSQLATNVDRARRAYVDILAKAVFAESKSRVVSWKNATHETTRIY